MQQANPFDELIIDNFAGGGGASTGIELATGRPVDIAINHDEDAISMHMLNHPHTKHYCESVWDVDPREATKGKPVGIAWFSPDCKHFSKAKGGKPVNKEIRGLAWIAVKWAATVRPRVIILENVEEFKTWGPVKDGQPIKKQAGRTFRSFINALQKYGYTIDCRELRACDYGAPTIRKRFFLIARCDGKPIVWPKPTHGDPKSDAVKIGMLKPWRTAAEIIDWTLPYPSIFDTSEEIFKKYGLRAVRPLAESTLKRIAKGLQKFVIENPEPFIVDFKFDNAPKHGGEPLNTITSVNGYGVVTPSIIQLSQQGFSGDGRQYPVDAPITTIVTKAEHCLVAPTLIQYHGEQSGKEVRGQSLDRPLMTADSANRYGLVMAFMSKYYSGGHQGSGNAVTEPLNTITAVDHNAIVASHLIKFKGQETAHPINEPMRTVTAGGVNFGEIRTFMVKYHGQDTLGIVNINDEQYLIADIGLRMLTPRELFNAQGFPPDYAIETGLDGKPITKAAQVARCGNAVPPPFAEALIRANLPEMCGVKISTMAGLNSAIAI